jgi:hypothetical protein
LRNVDYEGRRFSGNADEGNGGEVFKTNGGAIEVKIVNDEQD